MATKKYSCNCRTVFTWLCPCGIMFLAATVVFAFYWGYMVEDSNLINVDCRLQSCTMRTDGCWCTFTYSYQETSGVGKLHATKREDSSDPSGQIYPASVFENLYNSTTHCLLGSDDEILVGMPDESGLLTLGFIWTGSTVLIFLITMFRVYHPRVNCYNHRSVSPTTSKISTPFPPLTSSPPPLNIELVVFTETSAVPLNIVNWCTIWH